MNNITQQATEFAQNLESLEAQLKTLTESNYYKQLTDSGFYIVEVNLADALQAARETMQVNEQIITIMKLYPDDGLKMAIAKSLQSSADDDALTEIEPYL